MLVAAKTVPAETTLPVTLPPTSDEPAFVQARDGAGLALPARAEARPEPAFEGALPSTKSRGEIDRQLKSIIKDYGEYDLYSHQKSVNVKAAAIAAAAVALALVLGGFFFFRSAPSPAPATIETTGAPAAHTPEPGITKNLP
jgi:hypothetical protein